MRKPSSYIQYSNLCHADLNRARGNGIWQGFVSNSEYGNYIYFSVRKYVITALCSPGVSSPKPHLDMPSSSYKLIGLCSDVQFYRLVTIDEIPEYFFGMIRLSFIWVTAMSCPFFHVGIKTFDRTNIFVFALQ